MTNIADVVERAKRWPTDSEAWVKEAERVLYGSGYKSEPVIEPVVGPPKLPLVQDSQSVTDRPRILLLDIEMTPNLGYIYDVWRDNITQEKILETQYMLCFAYEWLHGPTKGIFSSFYDGKEEMLRAIWSLLNDADIVIHYNGTNFDIPHINRELLVAGSAPPAPYKQIDLYKTVKRHFNFTYNSMDHVCKQLSIQGKTDKIPFECWIAAMNDDKDAWDRIISYNMGDIEALKQLYFKLQPWIPNHPSVSVYTDGRTCPFCNSEKLQRRGRAVTNVSVYQRIWCASCGGWSRETSRNSGVTVRTVAS